MGPSLLKFFSLSHCFCAAKQTLVYQAFTSDGCELLSFPVLLPAFRVTYTSMVPDSLSNLMSMDSPYVHNSIFVIFSSVNLFHINLILRLARILEDRGKFLFPNIVFPASCYTPTGISHVMKLKLRESSVRILSFTDSILSIVPQTPKPTSSWHTLG